MVRRLALLALCLLFSRWAAALTVTTVVEPPRVHAGETVVVTYAVDGQGGAPDFTPLQEDFEIVDQRQSQNISIVNSQATYETVWSLVLMPRRTGELSLPPVAFGDATSEARTVTVADDSAGAGSAVSTSRSADAAGDVLVEYSVDDPTPHANQQVLLTTQVYTAVDVENLSVSTPEVVSGRAEVERLGRPREYHSMQGGRRYAVHEQRYTLVPKAVGMLELSPVEVTGRVEGKPVTRVADPPRIEVIDATVDPSRETGEPAPDELFVELEVDKRSPYVQQQVMFTVRLLRAIAIENATLSAPSVSGGDAVIERLGNDRQYQATRKDRRYSVTERRFVLYPQTSGALTIEPVRLQASIPVAYGGSSTGFWSRPLTRPVRVRSEAYELDVRAPPPGASRPWLPAADLTIEEEWPEGDAFEVGAPITRRLIVTAKEMLASQLPALETPLPSSLKSYPEKPRRETSAGEHGAIGQLEQIVTLIPSRAGTFTVPALELAWWNTRADRAETVRVPAHTFEVTAAPGSAPAGAGQAEAAQTKSRTGWAGWLSLGLGLAWLTTLVLWWADRRGRLLAPAAERPAVTGTASRRHAEKRLRDACRWGDPGAARDALLAWARAWRPDDPPRSLGALAAVTDDRIGTEIAGLQQALYAPGGQPWRGEALYRAVADYTPPCSAGGRDEVLQPLYQH